MRSGCVRRRRIQPRAPFATPQAKVNSTRNTLGVHEGQEVPGDKDIRGLCRVMLTPRRTHRHATIWSRGFGPFPLVSHRLKESRMKYVHTITAALMIAAHGGLANSSAAQTCAPNNVDQLQLWGGSFQTRLIQGVAVAPGCRFYLYGVEPVTATYRLQLRIDGIGDTPISISNRANNDVRLLSEGAITLTNGSDVSVRVEPAAQTPRLGQWLIEWESSGVKQRLHMDVMWVPEVDLSISAQGPDTCGLVACVDQNQTVLIPIAGSYASLLLPRAEVSSATISTIPEAARVVENQTGHFLQLQIPADAPTGINSVTTTLFFDPDKVPLRSGNAFEPEPSISRTFDVHVRSAATATVDVRLPGTSTPVRLVRSGADNVPVALAINNGGIMPFQAEEKYHIFERTSTTAGPVASLLVTTVQPDGKHAEGYLQGLAPTRTNSQGGPPVLEAVQQSAANAKSFRTSFFVRPSPVVERLEIRRPGRAASERPVLYAGEHRVPVRIYGAGVGAFSRVMYDGGTAEFDASFSDPDSRQLLVSTAPGAAPTTTLELIDPDGVRKRINLEVEPNQRPRRFDFLALERTIELRDSLRGDEDRRIDQRPLDTYNIDEVETVHDLSRLRLVVNRNAVDDSVGMHGVQYIVLKTILEDPFGTVVAEREQCYAVVPPPAGSVRPYSSSADCPRISGAVPLRRLLGDVTARITPHSKLNISVPHDESRYASGEALSNTIILENGGWIAHRWLVDLPKPILPLSSGYDGAGTQFDRPYQ